MESHPRNPEFRNNPENFHQCVAEETGLNLTLSETLKTGFVVSRPL